MIERNNALIARIDLVDQEIRAVLAGVSSEDGLLEYARRARPGGFGVDDDAGPGTPQAPGGPLQ
jgi:hypothetical protein